jgi:hypothetical protein
LFYAPADELLHDFAPERIGVMAEFPGSGKLPTFV